MSPTTRSGSAIGSPPITPTTPTGGPSPISPNAPVGGSPSTPKRKRSSSSTESSVSGGLLSSPSKRSRGTATRQANIITDSPPRTTSGTTLSDLPTEILDLVINESLPCKMPVRVHTYWSLDNELGWKVHLPEGSEKAQKWKAAIDFGRVNKRLRKVTKVQLKSLIRTGWSYIEVDLCGDTELKSFPSMDSEKLDLIPVDNDILDEFKEIRFLVPLCFTNQYAGTRLLLLAQFTFRFGEDDRQFWEMDTVGWAPLMLTVIQLSSGKRAEESRVGQQLEDVLQMLRTCGRRNLLNIPELEEMLRVLNENFRDEWIEGAIMGRGVSRDLLTLQCALARMPGFVTRMRQAEPADDLGRRDWVLDPLSRSVFDEQRARDTGII